MAAEPPGRRPAALQPAPTPDTNAVLRQLVGLRREFAAVLANQARDRELITRLASRMDEGFDRVEQNFIEVRRDLREVKNDVFSLENKILNRENEILEILQRLDEQRIDASEIEIGS